MPTVNIHAAKSQLSRLLDAAVAGEEVIIAKAGKPIARLVPIEQKKERRKLGTLAGQVPCPGRLRRPAAGRHTGCLRRALMRFLLDTHLLLWALNDPERLGGATRDAIEDPANDILFSIASIWEVAIKHGSAVPTLQSEPRRSPGSTGARLCRTADPVAVRVDRCRFADASP